MIECWIIESSLKRDEIALIKWFKSVELRNQLMDMIRLEPTINIVTMYNGHHN